MLLFHKPQGLGAASHEEFHSGGVLTAVSVPQVSAGRTGAACSEAADHRHTPPAACCGGAGAGRRELGTKDRPVDKDLHAGCVKLCPFHLAQQTASACTEVLHSLACRRGGRASQVSGTCSYHRLECTCCDEVTAAEDS